MKSVLLIFVAVLFTALSFQVSYPEADFYISESDMLKAIPSWDLLPAQTASNKSENKILSIQQDFVAEISFSTDLVEHITPVYYLPIYKLHREKEYFLLI